MVRRIKRIKKGETMNQYKYEKCIEFIEKLLLTASENDKKELKRVLECLQTYDALYSCISKGKDHIWGMTDKQCVEECYELINQFEKVEE